MHLFDFLPCPHPGWLLIKTFLELESRDFTGQEVRYGNPSSWALWRLKDQMRSHHTWGTRRKAYGLPSALPPIHLDCGFHPLSPALREGGKR